MMLALVLIIGMTSMGRETSAQTVNAPSVTIAINDYASVPGEQLALAQRAVTDAYAAIGLETVWVDTRRFSQATSHQIASSEPEAANLTVIVLSEEMVRKWARPLDVLGFAPCTPTERGRIAYVFYERLQSIATALHRGNVDFLGVVIAHEIGHLLLPCGSHSDTGVMRGRWQAQELPHADLRQLAFTANQAEQIRQRTMRAAP